MKNSSLENPKVEKSKDILEIKLKGTHLSAFLIEFLGNSGHFLILKILSDIIVIGWFRFITDPTEYLLAIAMFIQTWYLSRSNSHRFWGNLICVGIYTLIDAPIDGLHFFLDPTHIVFWLFSLIIAILQGSRFNWVKGLDNWLIPLESLTRALMVVACYLVVSIKSKALVTDQALIINFTSNPNHSFLIWSMILIGLLLGLQSLQLAKQRKQLQATAKLLGNMAEWGMGSHVVNTALSNPEALAFQKCDRTILFMDIRGFTAWCEKNSPDLVAVVLNEYYKRVEPAATQYHPLRITFTGDEVMAIYATPQQGIAAAQAISKAASEILNPYVLGAGCGLHCGSVIEGLFGGEDVRTYTVIGDVVNTAKRLEGATPAGAVTISDAVYQSLSKQLFQESFPQLQVDPCEPIYAKGKSENLVAWRLKF